MQLTRNSKVVNTWQSMIATPLYVEGCQVHTRSPHVRLFKEVVDHFRGHQPVHWHHGGHHNASDQAVQLTLEEEGRIVENLPQRHLFRSFATLNPTSPCLLLSEQSHVGSDQAVPKSEEVFNLGIFQVIHLKAAVANSLKMEAEQSES